MKPTMHILAATCLLASSLVSFAAADLAAGFRNPPPSAAPWVYWFWMDGNLSREGITRDLEAMKEAGVGGVIIMEVDVGIPRGPVRFMSEPWRQLFVHVRKEATRLGLEIDLNASPGWTGSGGPWIKPEQSMQMLVSSATNVAGPTTFSAPLPQPPAREGFYRDVSVLAFPTTKTDYRIDNIQEKALYHRGHFSSEAGVRRCFVSGTAPSLPQDHVIPADSIVQLSDKLDPSGKLTWQVPPGSWTILRFGRTSTGANTRPAPLPGLGLECDKLDRAALEMHFEEYIGKLLGDLPQEQNSSLVSLHIDSWEMGPQNWTARFPEEFLRRRGYSLLLFLPVFEGRVVNSLDDSERFLWDLRQTVADLILENHADHLRTLANRHGMRLSIQPYDGTPTDDLAYGARADLPMCEFWANCFDTFFTCAEATSIAHTYGQRIVAAEAFTSDDSERWRWHPAVMKPLGDWAFCEGINRFVFHRYAHQPWTNRWPGMTMGPYGVHYERTQTWWPLVSGWHQYLARCQFMLQQGNFVSDTLYLTPEGSPHVFKSPVASAHRVPPERPPYNFDACTPETLLTRVSVTNGLLVLSNGAAYRLLVLPQGGAATPALARRIQQLVEDGAAILGPRLTRSPSLSGQPASDAQVRTVADLLWGPSSTAPQPGLTEHAVGRGRVFAVSNANTAPPPPPLSLAKAAWIWHPEGKPQVAAPVSRRHFRRTLVLDAAPTEARAALTADNGFELWINGQSAGKGENFHHQFEFDIAPLLHAGTNTLFITSDNGGSGPNPAGLIAAFSIRVSPDQSLSLHSDAQWESTDATLDSPAQATSAKWLPAKVLGPLGMGPWGKPARQDPPIDIYPKQELIGQAMARLGVAPDFQTDGPFRYTHRRDGDTDLYFISNRSNTWAGAECRFRVAGKSPELWDPRSGTRRPPLSFAEDGSHTRIPLWLGPNESLFVVFQPRPSPDTIREISRDEKFLFPRNASTQFAPPMAETRPDSSLLFREGGQYRIQMASGRDHTFHAAAPQVIARLDGPWDIQFISPDGSQKTNRFLQLIDWTRHTDPAIQHFSGQAVYTLAFDIPADALKPKSGRAFELDLGGVEVMSRVTLNGTDLGVLWTHPFRIDITAALRPGHNNLSVTVANLWPNRLIGDQAVPAAERKAWTTWNPFRKSDPLLPSGLLGPVRIHAFDTHTLK